MDSILINSRPRHEYGNPPVPTPSLFFDFLEDTMIRSMLISLAVGAAALAGCMTSEDTSATDDTAAVAQNSGGGFDCINKLNIQVVSCTGGISILPINVDIKDVRALN